MAIRPSQVSRSSSVQFWSQRLGLGLGSIAVATLGLGNPALAGDPFPRTPPAPIGDKTEAAFKAMFEESNYKEAAALLEEAVKAEKDEPLIYPMLALLAQYEGNDKGYEKMRDYAAQTGSAAETIKDKAIKDNDDLQLLRGHLYTAVAKFIEGAHVLSPAGKGPVRGLGEAFGKLRAFNSSMAKARKINPDDPELNLLEGFTDMYASAYLPLKSTDAAVKKLEKAGPSYLGNWLTGLGYRILDKHDKGIDAVDAGLAIHREHPEMNYLRAQLERQKAKKGSGSFEDAQDHFDKALANPDVLPKQLVIQMLKESCDNQSHLDGKARACDIRSVRNAVNGVVGSDSLWGPKADEMPEL